MTIHINAGLAMAMQSAIAAGKTISGITKAAPGVITATAHGYSNGDIVLIECEGMIELNHGVFEVANVATDTFQIVGPDGTTGIDTSAYNTFSSGTAKKLTLGTSVTGVQGFSPSGGEVKFQDTTTVHDLRDKQRASGITAMSYALDMQWDPANAGQAAMKAAFESGASKAFKITWPDGAYAMWYGSVGFSGAPGGEKQGTTTTQAALAMDGPLTVAA